MKKIWARVGMTINVTDEEYKALKILTNSEKPDDTQAASDILNDLVSKRGYIDGNSYLPNFIACEENPNEDDFDFRY